MVNVIFYEKPGCINNAKQKALLMSAGHAVDSRNLLVQPWTAETLRPFFGTKPVTEWFNPTAPRIKSGEIVPSQLDEETAIALTIADPLLIRRPLIQVGDIFTVGFDTQMLDNLIGLAPGKAIAEDLETCPRDRAATPCELPAHS